VFLFLQVALEAKGGCCVSAAAESAGRDRESALGAGSVSVPPVGAQGGGTQP